MRTTRSFWLYVAASLAFVPVSVALAIKPPAQPRSGRRLGQQRRLPERVRPPRRPAALMLLLIGILLMAGEFRHNTATSTFLITPDRRRVVGAKLAASGVRRLRRRAGRVAPDARHRTPVALRGGRRLAARSRVTSRSCSSVRLRRPRSAGVVGVGFGALVPNQTVAVTAALVWMTTVEGTAGLASSPRSAAGSPAAPPRALSEVATANGGLLPDLGRRAFLFAAYGLAFAAAGTRFVLRRDIA